MQSSENSQIHTIIVALQGLQKCFHLVLYKIIRNFGRKSNLSCK